MSNLIICTFIFLQNIIQNCKEKKYIYLASLSLVRSTVSGTYSSGQVRRGKNVSCWSQRSISSWSIVPPGHPGGWGSGDCRPDEPA